MANYLYKNYTIIHLHSDLSNGVTNIDSVTKYKDYILRAKELGMKALGFSEHGSTFSWCNKKRDIEDAGMKYIHGAEVYITETLEEKIRDNYHCVLIAKNNDGRKELNKLISKSFNREDNHFYYVPRISLDELVGTSNNIIVTTACLGGILNKGTPSAIDKFLSFLNNNKHRAFLEIQHHNVESQKDYNNILFELSKELNIPLIAGTDTHALNEEHLLGRKVLQNSKNTSFEGEDEWDLSFKSYFELCDAYKVQNSLPEEVYLEAIENTNVLADMVEEFELDLNTKYPKLYDNPLETFREKIYESYENHKYLKDRYSKEDLFQVFEEEIDVYNKTQSIDFMLLQKYLRDWEIANDIYCGYGRGSVSGSEVAYALGVTEMDSKKFGLNFFRFQNPSRVTNCDIDTDYQDKDRNRVKEFILKDRMNLNNLNTCEIITFNTIAMKGAIKDIGRAFNMDLDETQEISDAVFLNDKGKWDIDSSYRKKYPKLFEYVDLVQGTIVSIGSHPSGVLVSDLDIEEEVGLCTLSASEYPVSMLDMKELDYMMFVKLDILG